MSMIQRHSSRQESISQFLPDVLLGASGYDRIAGYFRSSMLDIAGEAIEQMADDAEVRIICNSELEPNDIITARAAQQGMVQEWKRSLPADITPALQATLQQLFRLLRSGKLKVRVLPQQSHGLLHGKAGIVRRADGSRLSFVGSANETASAWRRNYEIVWADRSAEGCDWVQAEFDALWNHADAHDLADAVIVDIERIATRRVISDIDEWKANPESADAGATIELPIYLQESGLWAHQKWFVHHAFALHRKHGARLVLADQVGLGKTVQLALAAKLMLLWGQGNVLVVVPKPLMEQWQGELWDLLRLPSAYWDGKRWVDEQNQRHIPTRAGYQALKECPRRLGIVSGGLVKAIPEVRRILAGEPWECVILDEAHHARRQNTGRSKAEAAASGNNLMEFMLQIAPSTKSLLLATATPVQIDPIEAFDLLSMLNEGNGRVLGRTVFSKWRLSPREGLAIISGSAEAPTGLEDIWPWMRDPFPDPLDVDVEGDSRAARIRETIIDLTDPVSPRLGTPIDRAEYPMDAYTNVRPAERGRLEEVAERYFDDLNPYIAHIVRRTRSFLENETDPQTHEPFLPKVEVQLFGDKANDSVEIPFELRQAFEAAEEFCKIVGQRPNMNSGFLETLLLRRVGSSLIAGLRTARKMLGNVDVETLEEEDEGEGAEPEDENMQPQSQSKLQPLSSAERTCLERFVALVQSAEHDPKYDLVLGILSNGASISSYSTTEPWIDAGCILFSQYLDTARWLAEKLTKEFPEQPIALYAGAGKSGIYRNGMFESKQRDVLKQLVRTGEIRLVIGTDAASEGLNLQRLGTLINVDLPWNPTRLEQRKGRIQRIGQVREQVFVYNMRYRDSVEDRVHKKLSDRLQSINDIFGQLPDTLEAVWIDIARRNEAEADKKIDAVPTVHPFVDKYDRIANVDWESCNVVLDSQTQLDALMRGWDGRKP